MDREQRAGGANEPPANRLRRRAYLGFLSTAGLAGVAGCIARNPSTGPSTTSDNGPPSPTPSDETTPATPSTDPSTTSSNGPSATVNSACAEPLSAPPDRRDSSGAGGSIAWETSVPTSLRSIVPLDETRLLVGTDDGTLAALTRETGDVVWKSDLADLVSTPLVEGDTILVQGTVRNESGWLGEATLHALDADSGEERWTALTMDVNIGGAFRVLDTTRELALVRETTDVLPNEMPLHAVSLSDGSTRWTAELGSMPETVIEDETIYYSGYDGVTAFAPDGTRIWEWSLDDPSADHWVREMTVVCDHVVVYTENETRSGSGDEYAVHGLNTETGERAWTFDAWRGAEVQGYRGRLLVGGGAISQLNPTSGDPIWTRDRPLHRSTSAYDVVIGYTEHADRRELVARSIPDGTIEWAQESGGFTTPEGVIDGRIIARRSTDDSSYLGAIDAATGEQYWGLEAEHRFESFEGVTADSKRVYVIDQPDREDAQGTVRAVLI
jgi:outer membrane protein assembly factor BamB